MKHYLCLLAIVLSGEKLLAQGANDFDAKALEKMIETDLKKSFEKKELPDRIIYGIGGTPFCATFHLKERFLILGASFPATERHSLERINDFNQNAIYSRVYLENEVVVFEVCVIPARITREQALASFQYAEKEWCELRKEDNPKSLAPQFDASRMQVLGTEPFEQVIRNDWKKGFDKKKYKHGFNYDVKDTPIYLNYSETGRFVNIYRNLDNQYIALAKINAFNKSSRFSRAYLGNTTLAFEMPCLLQDLSQEQFLQLIHKLNDEWAAFSKLAKESMTTARAGNLSAQDVHRWWNHAIELGKQARYSEAATIYFQLLPWAAHYYGANGSETATILNNLGVMHCHLGSYGKAEPFLERSLRIREALDIPDVADSLNSLSNMYQGMGFYSRAEPFLKRSLSIWQKQHGDDHLEVAHLFNNLGNLYRRTGLYAKAEEAYLRCLGIREKQLDKNHSDMAQILYNMANFYEDFSQYDKAEPLCLRSLKIWESNLGPDHPNVADAVLLLGNLDYALGQYAKAEEHYQRSLRIAEGKLGKNHPMAVRALENLANLYTSSRRYAEAEPLFERVVQIHSSSLGKDHPAVARSLGRMATLHVRMGQNEKAAALRERSVQILEAKLGKTHPDVALALNNLANSLEDLGQMDKAETLYRQCLEIIEAKLGPQHPEVVRTLTNMGWNAAYRAAWPDAIKHVQNGRQKQAAFLTTTLSSLSEPEQLAYLETQFEWGFHRALSLGWSAPKHAAEASAEWLLNGRAIAHQTLAEQHLLLRDTKDPAHRRLFDQLQEIRSRLAALIHQSPKPGFEQDHQQELRTLTVLEQERAQHLARALGRSHRADSWISLADFKAKLDPKVPFVDIARFEAHDFAGRKNVGPRYAAWIVLPRESVKIIDLGPADAIDRLVEETRKELIASAKAITELGESDAVAKLQTPLQKLSAKVLHPLLPELQKYEEWIVCPDGALWLTPWNALLLPDGRYFVEQHLVHPMVTGRDLLKSTAISKSGNAYLFADPDYDLKPNKMGMPMTSDGNAARSAAGTSMRIPKVARLPGTAAEAQAIQPKIEHWLGKAPQVFLEDQATEAMVKSMKDPAIMAIATHGYFLPKPGSKAVDRPLAVDRKSPVLNAQGQPFDNPLLRCGLLLAGCNQRTQESRGANDGILTGLEILGLNLNECTLVVLSACETGLGDVRHSEGVAGLRQAFQLAGAKGVLASLWQVPDRETALLMNGFFEGLAKGKGQAQSLREAQLQRLTARRNQFGAAHPFFWSAFVLTGQGIR